VPVGRRNDQLEGLPDRDARKKEKNKAFAFKKQHFFNQQKTGGKDQINEKTGLMGVIITRQWFGKGKDYCIKH